MRAEEMIRELERWFPQETAEDWDNPGIQVGRPEQEVEKVFVALDATDAVIGECVDWGADLLVTHHPLMLSGIRQVNSLSMTGRKVLALAENRILHYAMHTNYDVMRMGALAAEALKMDGWTVLEKTGAKEDGSPLGIGCVGALPCEMTAGECGEAVKKAFGLPHVRLFGDPGRRVRRAAVCPGSGKSLIGAALAAGAQIYITGDIGHHDGVDAVDQGLILIDAGHYGLEHLFLSQVAGLLRQAFPGLAVRQASFSEPFLTL